MAGNHRGASGSRRESVALCWPLVSSERFSGPTVERSPLAGCGPGLAESQKFRRVMHSSLSLATASYDRTLFLNFLTLYF